MDLLVQYLKEMPLLQIRSIFLYLPHNPMWNMAVHNISYHIYPLSTKIEKITLPKSYISFYFSIYNVYLFTFDFKLFITDHKGF